MFLQSRVGNPDRPTRSTTTVAGIRGFSFSRAATAGSTALIPEFFGARTTSLF